MSRVARFLAISVSVVTLGAGQAAAESGGFIGLDLGVAEPTNSNYRAHVHTGAVASPYGGYMFNDVLGLQANVHIVGNPADDDNRGFENENQWTSLVGLTVGPRLTLPTWDVPIFEAMETYITGQGGFFSGTSGRMTDTKGGVSIGGGVDLYLTDHWALSGFGRWNHLWMQPRPYELPSESVVQSLGEQGPKNADFATVGVGVKYDFREPPAPPECPVCVCPDCPVRRKLVLRNVHFDFDRHEVRGDAVPVLREAAEILKGEEGEFTLLIEGHTDSTGPESYNEGLSQRRADSVRRWLIDAGIPAERIKAVGYGERKPVADNSTAAGRAMNRRVEQKLEE